VEVLTKHRTAAGITGTRFVYPSHPFDVVGWDGCLYPYTFNVSDFEPITGRVHQPPPVHQVFESVNFVICSVRAAQGGLPPAVDPGAVLPLERRLRRGHVLLRRQLRGAQGLRHRPGLVSLHPGGHPHGPQPGAYERSIGVEFFDELAVMVDTFRPLELGEGGRASDDGVYPWSWAQGRRAA
jgi:homogentisate 1,2-dioxygenase